MEVDEQVERVIHERPDDQQLRGYLASTDFTTLREEGLQLAESGLSSLEEILRVTVEENMAPANRQDA
jgi:type II secretory ATPase GspE/PulE/Tfp pilus assembly ATPase PilB-like protein